MTTLGRRIRKFRHSNRSPCPRGRRRKTPPPVACESSFFFQRELQRFGTSRDDGDGDGTIWSSIRHITAKLTSPVGAFWAVGQNVKVLAGGAVGVDRSAAWSSVERGTVTSLRVSGSTAGGMQPQGIKDTGGAWAASVGVNFFLLIVGSNLPRNCTCTRKIDSSPTKKKMMCTSWSIFFRQQITRCTN
jgi:hypothetical protein